MLTAALSTSDAALHLALGLADGVVVLAVAWLAGWALARGTPPAERLAWGMTALLAVAWTTMLQPLLGVSLVGHPLLAGILVAVAVVALARRGTVWHVGSRPCPGPLVVWLAALSLLSLPLALSPTTTIPQGDMHWHEGWIRQLSDGLPAPTAIYEHVPISYPWLFHAIGAWVALLPGDMTETFWVLEIVAITALVLGLWLLARQLGFDERAATWAALFGSTGAGLGWIWQHQPLAILDRSLGAGHGDFIASSAVTPALGNLPAIVPRDLAISLFPMTVWFILRAASGHRMREAAAAGGLVGALLLIGPVAAIVACATAGPLAVHRTLRAQQIVLAVGVAAVVTGVWTGPMVLDYLDLGGFVRTDPRTSVTAAHAVVGMGVPALLGAAGLLFLLLARRADVDIPALVVLAGVPALFCLATGVLPGHTIGGIAPALRLQRYLPFLALALTLPAGWGVAEILGRLHRWPGTIVAIVLLSTSTASTLLTGLGLRDMFDRAPRLALVCENGPQVRAGQVVAVAGLDEPDTREVDDEVFRSTGAWVLWREEPRLRYREIFTRIATQQQRHAATENLTDGVVPSDVDWILFPRDAPSPTGLQPVAACRAALSTHRMADFRLYRPPALD